MENILHDDVRNRDGLASTEEKRAEPGHRRQQLQDSTELLNLPLGAKVPVDPGSSTVFHRTKLGVKLHQSAGHFDLGDPHCHLLGNEYNSLHDPHLQEYYNGKVNLRRLRREGFITKDGKVVCNLREFNQYRQYLTTLKIQLEKTNGREQEPKPQGSKKCSKEQQHAKTRTTLNWNTLREVRELAESTVKKVLQRVRELEQTVHILRSAPLAIRGRLFCSRGRAEHSEKPPPEVREEVLQVAKEIAAALLGHLAKQGAYRASDASEPRLLADRERQQRIGAGPTQAGKLGERKARQAELPGFDGGLPLPSLDKILKDAAENIAATLQMFAASQLENHFHCKYSEMLKLPVKTICERQLQPPQAPSSNQVIEEGASSRASEALSVSRAKNLLGLQTSRNPAELSQGRSVLQGEALAKAISKVQQLHSELKVDAETFVRDALECLKKELQQKLHAKTRALAQRSEESTAESGPGEQRVRSLTAGDRGVHCRRQLAKEPNQREGNGSNVGQVFPKAEGRKTPPGELVESLPRTKLPPLMVHGMVMLSEDEAEAQSSEEKRSAHLLPSVCQSSEHLAHNTPPDMQKPHTCSFAGASRPHSTLLEKQPKVRPGSTQEPFPSIAQQYCRQPIPPAAPRTPSQSKARMRPNHVKLVKGKPGQCEC